jgi:hypothetical protein
MKRAFGTVLFAGALACLAPGGAGADDKEAKGAVVDFDGLKSTTPGTWKEEQPSSRMRLAQFRLPRAKGDSADAEVTIFKGFGGTARQNVDRWKQQFLAPKGKSIDDVSKVSEIKIGGHEATYLDIHGTYLYKERPIDPASKTEKRPDYRMLAVHFEGPENNYHVRLVGPAKTVEQYKKGFDGWLKAFK